MRVNSDHLLDPFQFRIGHLVCFLLITTSFGSSSFAFGRLNFGLLSLLFRPALRFLFCAADGLLHADVQNIIIGLKDLDIEILELRKM
jgi:hypothetical protein